MTGSWRARPLPPNWPALRLACLTRDGFRCTEMIRTGMGPLRCPDEATDADHLDRNGPDELWNLGAKCRDHHATKSGREGAAQSNAQRQQMIEARVNPAIARPHPGLRPPPSAVP